MALRNIFFDIGFTLLFQNTAITLAPLKAAGFSPTQQQLYAAEKFAKTRLDAAHAKPGSGTGVDFAFWENYHRHLMQSLGVQDDVILGELILLSRTSGNWMVPAPGIPALLELLREGYKLGVISNADGKLKQSLQRLDLEKYFVSITDSGVVGQEKPSLTIFQSALESLGADPHESLYVGDIYSLDYNGARNASMNALLIDVADVYEGSPFIRIRDFTEFHAALEKIAAD